MRVHIVRSAEVGCDPDCPEWIAAQGKLDLGVSTQFKKILRGLGERKLPVFIHSGGGSVRDAIAIGRLLRAKGLDVAVSRTLFIPCTQSDDACRKREREGTLQGVPQTFSVCASACAFILAGGVRRFVGPWTQVGVHQMKSFYTHVKVWRTYRLTPRPDGGVTRTIMSEKKISAKTVERQAPEHDYDEVGQYFAKMGIGKELMALLEATPYTSMHWLTQNELRSTGLSTDYLGAEQLLPRANRPSDASSSPRNGGDRPSPPSVEKCDPFARLGFSCNSGQPWQPAFRAPQ